MDSFIALQPIFERDKTVFGYELLFRSGLENACLTTDLDHASSKVIADTLHLVSIESLTGGRKAFVNVTREVLVREYAALLPRELTIVEVLEGVEADEPVLAACRALKRSGYRIALDDFEDRPGSAPLVDLADVIKVDFRQTAPSERQEIASRHLSKGIQLLAEKVETQEAFDEAIGSGYSLFQGYFFAKPAILTNQDIPGFKLHLFRILQEIHKPDLDFDRVEAIIRQDPALCYKFLRYINSAWFGWQEPIRSLRRALALLGEREVRRWVTLIALAALADDKPRELLVHAVTRARFCELLAPKAGLEERGEDCFLMGMFSLIDAMLDRPLESVLADLPISNEVRDALLASGGPLVGIFGCAVEYEKGDWDAFSARAVEARVEESLCPRLYLESVMWGRRCFQES